MAEQTSQGAEQQLVEPNPHVRREDGQVVAGLENAPGAHPIVETHHAASHSDRSDEDQEMGQPSLGEHRPACI